MFFLLQIETLTEAAQDVTPYSEAVFGFVLALLSFIAFQLWRALQKERDDYKRLAEKSLGLLAKVENHLADSDRIVEISQEIREYVRWIKEKIDTK